MHGEPVTLRSGYYGKIPSTGDFIRYNLTRAFIEPWDDWLQTAITQGRETMGQGWLDVYLTSPLYRFVLTPGICGDGGWQGVIMPSVDRVGRYFPMTIARPLEMGENPFRVLLQTADWFSRTESLILSLLQEAVGPDALNRAIAELDQAAAQDEAQTCTLVTDKIAGGGEHLAIREPYTPGVPPDALYPELLDSVLLECGFAYSLWLTEGSESVSPSILTCQGLPPSRAVNAMLDGRWAHWGWLDKHTPMHVIHLADEGEKDPWEH